MNDDQAQPPHEAVTARACVDRLGEKPLFALRNRCKRFHVKVKHGKAVAAGAGTKLRDAVSLSAASSGHIPEHLSEILASFGDIPISAKFSGISRRRSVTAQVAADAPPGETSVLGFADATAPREVTIWVGGNAPSELVDISAVSELLSIAGGTVDARVLLENGTRVLEVADAGTLFEESADDDADDESRKSIKASLKIVALHVVDGEGPKRKSTLAARVLGFEASRAVTGAQTDLEVRLERLQVDQFAADARWPVLLRGSDEADADPAPLVEATCVREGNTLRCRSGVSLLPSSAGARNVHVSWPRRRRDPLWTVHVSGHGVAANRLDGLATSRPAASPRRASTDSPRRYLAAKVMPLEATADATSLRALGRAFATLSDARTEALDARVRSDPAAWAEALATNEAPPESSEDAREKCLRPRGCVDALILHPVELTAAARADIAAPAARPRSMEYPRGGRGAAATPSPRNIHAASSTEYPRGGRGVAATRLHGIFTRPRRDPRNIHAAPAAAPRPAPTEYPRGTRGGAATPSKTRRFIFAQASFAPANGLEETADDAGEAAVERFSSLRALSNLAELDKAQLRLKSFGVEHAVEEPGLLARTIARHYVMAALTQLHRVVGSLASLGQPANLVSTIGGRPAPEPGPLPILDLCAT